MDNISTIFVLSPAASSRLVLSPGSSGPKLWPLGHSRHGDSNSSIAHARTARDHAVMVDPNDQR